MSKWKKFLAAAEARLIVDWWTEAKRLWSIRLQLIVAAMSGLYAAWPAFQDHISPGKFAAISVVLSILTVGLRLVAQSAPASEDGGGVDA